MAQRTPIKIPTETEPEADRGIPPEPPRSFVPRPAPVNALVLGQQLADALVAARALINRTPTESAVAVDQLRRWYYGHDPAHRDRLLWRHFEEAMETHVRLEHAIDVAWEALDDERPLLVNAHAEREALAAHPLPATIEEEATGIRADSLRRYQSLGIECQQRTAAIADLERLLRGPERVRPDVIATVARVLEAVVTIDREAFVQRVCESRELEDIRSRLKRLRAMANTHEAELAEWSQRAGRSLRVPSVDFPWPTATVWKGLLDAPVEAPKLVWSDDPK